MFVTQKSLSILNLTTPKILMSQKLIASIAHIVKIAPQEAQWFNVIESVERTSNSTNIKLSDTLYIPEQVCSLTEVDTNSNMLVGFYRELMASNSLEEVNSLLSNMNCWSHSHHTMQVNPSLQDSNQFEYFVTQNKQQGNDKPYLMLIFNKHGQVYSRFYDNLTGFIYQGLQIEVIDHNDYDFSYINSAAKAKFKSPPKPVLKWNSQKSSLNNFSSYGLSNYAYTSSVSDSFEELIRSSNEKAKDTFFSIYSKKFPPNTKVSTLSTYLSPKHFVQNLAIEVGDLYSYWFSKLLYSDFKNIDYSKSNDLAYLESISNDIDNEDSILADITLYFETSKDSLRDLVKHLQALWILTDSSHCSTSFQEAIEYIQDDHYDN